MTFPIDMYSGHAEAVPLNPPRIVLSELRIIGMIVQLAPLLLDTLVFYQPTYLRKYLHLPPPIAVMKVRVYPVAIAVNILFGLPDTLVSQSRVFEHFLQDRQCISTPISHSGRPWRGIGSVCEGVRLP